jgi:hypothetical protein
MLRSLSLKAAVIAVALPVISLYPPSWGGSSSAVLTSAVAQPVPDQTTTVSDPVGDANFNAPAFQDVVVAQMTKTAGGDFHLLMEMAGPVPATPPMPPPARTVIWWAWAFDLDPTTSPPGWPNPPPVGLPGEFVVIVSWDGTEFAGTAVDRRPLLTGGEAIFTPVTFSINGKILEADLPYALIGDVPPSFGWDAFIWDWPGPVGKSGGFVAVDLAFATFP